MSSRVGEKIPGSAGVHIISGCSAHADRNELLAWHRSTVSPRTFPVHGEEPVMRRFAELLRDAQVERPALGEAVDL